MKSLILILFLTFLVTGCSTKKEVFEEEKKEVKNRMEPVSFAEIKGFFEDDLNYALEVFKKDCQKSKKYEQFKSVCQKAQYETDGRKFFIVNFQPYKLYDSNSHDEGTITGYYEPLLYGSLKKSARYKYPVYKIAKNLITSDNANLEGYKSRGKLVGKKIVPYDTRKEIESNPNNPNLEVIAYVDDKFDLFFLHIQGSGKIQLDNGKLINVAYAEQNGRAYTSIGGYLISQGLMTKDEMSVQSMKKFFANNPSKMDYIFNLNESYIFFKISNQAATGALNTVLTPKRNLAVDKSYIPLGTPVFLNTQNPVSKQPINQMMVAADVGGAIKGEIRADFFWGFGKDAFEYAGRMKEKGKMYILLPKN